MSAEAEVVMPGRPVSATAAAYGIAGLVHLGTAGLLAGGLLLVVLGLETVVQPLIGLVLLALAAQLRPRLGRLDPDLPTLRREDAPALYALLDAIADSAGVRRVDVVQVGTDFAVRVSGYGVRHRRRLELGLPLWLTFAPQQRVAAIADELGHRASCDVRRGALVGLALSSLAGAAEFMNPRSSTAHVTLTASPLSRHAGEMDSALFNFNRRGQVANWLLWIPRLVVKGTVHVLTRLTLPGARRADFQADAVAARTASTEAALSALRDRRLADAVAVEVHRLAVAVRTLRRPGAARPTDQDFWAEVAAHAAKLPEQEQEQEQERAEAGSPGDVTATDSAAQGSPVEDSGLPPVSLRMARLSLGPALPAAVTLDAHGADVIEHELRESKRLLARKVIQDCVHA